jgi:hypothetical protein
MAQTTTEIASRRSDADRGYAAAASLLEKWLVEEDGYDDRVWPVLEEELKDVALKCRDTNEIGT